jgi:hypothetical protein
MFQSIDVFIFMLLLPINCYLTMCGAGLVLSYQRSFTPVSSSVITAVSLVYTSSLLAFPGN